MRRERLSARQRWMTSMILHDDQIQGREDGHLRRVGERRDIHTTIKFDEARTCINDDECEWRVRQYTTINLKRRGRIPSRRRWQASSRRKVNEERGSHGRGVKTWTDEEAAEKLASLRPRNDGRLIIVGFNSTVTMDVCTGTTRMTTRQLYNVRLEKCDNDNSICNIIKKLLLFVFVERSWFPHQYPFDLLSLILD